MPRPRFEKLPPDKQERLLAAAEAEISEKGLQDASLNKILEAAGFSKGVAYYYFEDREDLLATVLRRRMEASMVGMPFDLAAFTAETFWPMLENAMVYIADPAHWDPNTFNVARAMWNLPQDRRSTGAMGELWGEMIAWVQRIISRGREVGQIRTDLPEELLVAIAMGVGEACDRWALTNWETMTPDEMRAFGRTSVDLLQRVLAPEVASNTDVENE